MMNILITGAKGERWERRRWRIKRPERVAAATSLPTASGGVKGKRSVCSDR